MVLSVLWNLKWELRSLFKYRTIATKRMSPNICMIVWIAVAVKSNLLSSLKERYIRGNVKNALAMASHPATFKILEVKPNPLGNLNMSRQL